MTSRTRKLVLAISIPVIAFAVIGGYLGQAVAQEGSYRSLRAFDDVLSLVLSNYVEPVDVRVAMRGAMRGMADGLDPDSAYLPPDLVTSIEQNENPGDAELGIDVTKQYYLRVVSVRDGSPAAEAGLRAGDFIRAIDGRATRDMSAVEGARLLRGAPGSDVELLVIRGNAADPHTVQLTRARLAGSEIASRMADASTGYIRVVEFTENTPDALRRAVDTLAGTGAARYVIDLRGTSRGDLDHGIAAARLFVDDGTLAVQVTGGDRRETIAAQPGDGAITAPVALLVNIGTAGAAEVFAAALDDNDRADLVGQSTLGRAARQRLVKLPDQSGLWLTYMRYLTPDGDPLHQEGLEADVDVDQPDVEFGDRPAGPDETLLAALEHLS